MHWDQVLLHGLCVSCLCTLFLLSSQLNSHRNSLAFQRNSHLHSHLLWHTGEHSHPCRGTVSLLGCPLVLRAGHADLGPLSVKKHVWMCWVSSSAVTVQNPMGSGGKWGWFSSISSSEGWISGTAEKNKSLLMEISPLNQSKTTLRNMFLFQLWNHCLGINKRVWGHSAGHWGAYCRVSSSLTFFIPSICTAGTLICTHSRTGFCLSKPKYKYFHKDKILMQGFMTKAVICRLPLTNSCCCGLNGKI